MAQEPDRKYIEKLKDVNVQPVFILGLHRSGTSILYKMLTATGSFNSVTAYHVICYDQLLYNKINGKEQDEKEKLTSSFVQQGPADRGIDKLKIDADFAEEYCFLLANKGYASNINSRNLPLFIQMMKKIQFVSGNNKPILLKNPYDLAHFLFIKEKIPNAKFVFIHRNPYHVLSSMMKAIRYLFKGKDLYGIQLNRIYKRVIENPVLSFFTKPITTIFSPLGLILVTVVCSKSTNYYVKNVGKLSKEDYVDITYEDLCARPKENIDKILNSLGIKSDLVLDYKAFIEKRKVDIDPCVKQMNGFIFKRMKRYFTKFNFDKDLS